MLRIQGKINSLHRKSATGIKNLLQPKSATGINDLLQRKSATGTNNLLHRAFRVVRPAFVTAIVFSFFINLLVFVSPLYMLQIYDRVISSRNVYTLLMLTLIAAFLIVVYAALEKLRSAVLVRAGLLFDTRNTIGTV